MNERTDYRSQLQAGRWFQGLPEALQTHLLALAQPRQLPPGQRLFARGDALRTVLRGRGRDPYQRGQRERQGGAADPGGSAALVRRDRPVRRPGAHPRRLRRRPHPATPGAAGGAARTASPRAALLARRGPADEPQAAPGIHRPGRDGPAAGRTTPGAAPADARRGLRQQPQPAGPAPAAGAVGIDAVAVTARPPTRSSRTSKPRASSSSATAASRFSTSPACARPPTAERESH